MRKLQITAVTMVAALLGALFPAVSFAAPATAATAPAPPSATMVSSVGEDTVPVPAKYNVQASVTSNGVAADITPTAHTINVAVVTPAGTTAPTVTDAQIDAHLATLSGYWVDQTNGLISSITRAGSVVRYASNYTCNQVSTGIWDEAAAKFGNTTSDYYAPSKHLLVIGPEGCGSAGLGTMPSPSITNGGLLWTQNAGAYMDIITHEFGHNMGLNHANAYMCSDPSNVTDTRGTAYQCPIEEYYDSPDVMAAAWTIGSSVSDVPTSLNSINRETLGLLGSGEQAQVGLPDGVEYSKTNYTITDAGLRNGQRSLKVIDPESGTAYYVEFRNGNGSDSKSLFGKGLDKYTSPQGNDGVRVIARSGSATINFTTAVANGGGRQLMVSNGQTLTSDSGLLKVTPVSNGVTTASVTVEMKGVNYTPMDKYSSFVSYASAPGEIIGRYGMALEKLTAADAAAVPANLVTNLSSQFLLDPFGNYYKVVNETVTPLTPAAWNAEGAPTPRQVDRAPALEYYSNASAPTEIIVRTPMGTFRHATAAEYKTIPAASIVMRPDTYYIRAVGDTQIYEEIAGVTNPITADAWAADGSPTPMVPVGTPIGTNPFATADPYVDPNYMSVAAATALRRAGRDADAAQVDKISQHAGSMWVGDWNGLANVQGIVDTYITSALNTGQTGVLVPYAIPGRSCGGNSAGGFTTEADYRTFIDDVAAGINGRRVAVILEPDAVLQLDRCTATELDRRGLLQYASAKLTAAGGTVYLDAGSSNAGTPQQMADKLLQSGIQFDHGFTLNTSNFLASADVQAYGEQLSALLGGKPYVIDTSRNGIGQSGEWCNTQGTALGALPAATTTGHQDANLWIKTVGASDGPCYGGPSAGLWWDAYAIALAKNATAVPAASTSATSMITRWNVGVAGCNTITLPLASTVNATVSWGDGTTSTVTAAYPSHDYKGATGVKSITVDGVFTRWGGKAWSSTCLLQVSKWGNTGTKSLEYGFYNANHLTSIVGIPRGIWNLSHAFDGVTGYTEQINWNMSGVTDMSWMFAGSDYNRPINQWNVSTVKSFNGMFAGTKTFNSPLAGWDTSAATTMSGMFLNAKAYNQPVGSLNVSRVSNFSRMFENAIVFNQPLGTWDVHSATNINSMFKSTPRFNQNLSTWSVSKVTNLNHTFDCAWSFNQPLNTWDVSSVTSMAYTFRGAKAYNQGMQAWNTAKVTTMDYMFSGAVLMNKNISGWNVAKVTARVGFQDGSALLAPAFK